MFLPQEAGLWGLNQQPLLPSWLNIRGWEENAVKLLTPHQDPAQFPWIGWIVPRKATVPVRCPSPPVSPLQISGPTPPPSPFGEVLYYSLLIPKLCLQLREGRKEERGRGKPFSLNFPQLPSLRTLSVSCQNSWLLQLLPFPDANPLSI